MSALLRVALTFSDPETWESQKCAMKFLDEKNSPIMPEGR